MSVAESHDFVNDLNEADFPYLSTKPSGKRADKGRRSGAERVAARTLADQATVVKTIHDPQNVLGKRRKARLASTCSDNIALDVPYSLNRKNRWEDVDVPTLAKNAEGIDVEVAIIEQTYKANEFMNSSPPADKANAVHLIAAGGSMKSKTARGKGASSISLIHGLKKEGSGSEAESEEGGARLEYRIVRPHPNRAVLCGSGKIKNQRNKNHRRNKKVDLDELEVSEMEKSYIRESEMDVYKPSRDFRFCLGDYLNNEDSEAPATVEIRRQSIQSVQPIEIEEVPSGPKPIDLLDISSVIRAPGAFENVYVNASRWPAFNFNQQVESLSTDEKIAVRWIDANHQRATVDLTNKLGHDDAARPELFVVLEKGRKGHFQLLLNSSIPSYGPFCWRTLKDIFKHKHVDSIPSAVEVIVAMVTQWKARQPPMQKPQEPESRYFQAGENFEVVVNSRSMAKQAVVVSEKEMSELLRETAAEAGGDSFERIDDDDLSFDDSLSDSSDIAVVPVTSVKCHTCKESAPEELFELDEYWQCRECLRQHIVNLIRTKNVPMEIPFVLCENGSAFDVLPALIPLPLINFYTKLAALEMMQCEDSDMGEIMECPSCLKDVKVEKHNEFRSCLCSSCHTAWCPDCQSEPHWPLTCQQFIEWNEKWEKQFAVESMGDELSHFIRRIHCGCGGITECGDKATRADCRNCGVSFNPSTLKLETKKYYWPYPPRYRKYIKNIQENLDLEVKEIALVPVLRVVKKEIATPCAMARTLRFNRQLGSEIEKKCRKMKDGDAGVVVFPELRRTILCLVEYGLAWLYVQKGPNSLKTCLIQLLKQCNELAAHITENKSNLGSRVASLDVALSKTLDQIKKAL